jgi:threonine synthase
MYNNDLKEFKKDFSSYAFTDEETKKAIETIYKKFDYIAEPHGAIGYMGLKKEMGNNKNAVGVFLETAHPIKFLDVVEPILNIELEIPKQIESVLNKEKKSISIKKYSDLKKHLLG